MDNSTEQPRFGDWLLRPMWSWANKLLYLALMFCGPAVVVDYIFSSRLPVDWSVGNVLLSLLFVAAGVAGLGMLLEYGWGFLLAGILSMVVWAGLIVGFRSAEPLTIQGTVGFLFLFATWLAIGIMLIQKGWRRGVFVRLHPR